MQTIEGSTIVVLEQNAIVRLGIEALLDSWGCQVISGDRVDELLEVIKNDNLLPDALLLPPINGQETGRQLADHFETVVGRTLPWIGITADLTLLQRWRSGEFDGVLLEMPCSPEALRAALLKVLAQGYGEGKLLNFQEAQGRACDNAHFRKLGLGHVRPPKSPRAPAPTA